MIPKSNRRSFFTAFACLPFLGFLKPESFTVGFDIGNEVCASTEAKPNTFRELYKFIKENNARLRYDKKNDCFVIEYFVLSTLDHYHCAFKGAEKDERSDGENYTRPALISLTRPMRSFIAHRKS